MRLMMMPLLAFTSLRAQSAAEHLAAGDRETANLNAPAAFAHYERAVAVEPRNYAALWKASNAAMDVAWHHPDESRKAALFATAERYARRAIEEHETDAEGYFALARALGKTALSQSSPRGKVRYASAVRQNALECLQRNPSHTGCLHIMGVWNAEVMRLGGLTRLIARTVLGGRVLGSASWKEAVRYMEEAVAHAPERIVHRIDLAEIHLDMGNTEKAKAEYETAVRLPVSDYNDEHYKRQAREALARL